MSDWLDAFTLAAREQMKDGFGGITALLDRMGPAAE